VTNNSKLEVTISRQTHTKPPSKPKFCDQKFALNKVKIGECAITSIKKINVLGVKFDSKLQSHVKK
jgi:hypothetical protein